MHNKKLNRLEERNFKMPLPLFYIEPYTQPRTQALSQPRTQAGYEVAVYTDPACAYTSPPPLLSPLLL